MKRVLMALLFLTACTSSPTKTNDFEAEMDLKRGTYTTAIKHQEEKTKQGSEKDRILNLYDLALVYHSSGKYLESNQTFRKLELELKWDKVNWGAEVLSLIDGSAVRFTLEDYETLLIPYYKSMNFIMLGDLESALVEIRKMDRLHNQIKRNNGGEEFGDTKFITYFSGVLHEAAKQYDDALIDYRKYEKQDKTANPLLRYDLYKCAVKSGREDFIQEIEKTYKIDDSYKKYARNRQLQSQASEVVIIFQNGLSPVKRAHNEFPSIPVFQPRNGTAFEAKITVDGEPMGQTYKLMDIDELAVKSLENKFARNVGRATARGVIAELGLMSAGVATFGTSMIAQLAVQMLDKPDLRAITYLPANIQVARIFLPGNKTYNFHFEFTGTGDFKDIEAPLQAGKTHFIIFRSASN